MNKRFDIVQKFEEHNPNRVAEIFARDLRKARRRMNLELWKQYALMFILGTIAGAIGFWSIGSGTADAA